MITLAFIGCGHIHTPGFIKLLSGRNDVKVKSVWDHDPARAAKRAGELSAQVVDNHKSAFVDNQISGVIVCSETHRHQEIVLAAAAAKKHMFVEKPLGMGARDGVAMADAIEKAGVKFQTGYMQRGSPVQLFIKDQIARGAFGKITRVRGSNCHGGAIGGWFDTEWRWMAEPKIAGVGAFGDLGTHSLDILLWWLGDVDSVTAMLDNGTARYPDCDETGEGLLRFKNGTIGTLAAAWDDVANPISYEICGTEGHASVINGQLFFQSKHVEGADGKQPWTNLPAPRRASMDAFLDALEGKDAALVTAREAAYRSVVMEAMYRGARERKWITI